MRSPAKLIVEEYGDEASAAVLDEIGEGWFEMIPVGELKCVPPERWMGWEVGKKIQRKYKIQTKYKILKRKVENHTHLCTAASKMRPPSAEYALGSYFFLKVHLLAFKL